MKKKVIYKITRREFEIIEVTTPEEEKLIEELNKEFERVEKAEQRYRARFLSLDELYETQGFEPADSSPSDDEDNEREAFYAQLHKAIDRLTPRQKEMVIKIFFENKTQVEVAEHYGISEAAVSQAMDRIYASLRRFLEKN